MLCRVLSVSRSGYYDWLKRLAGPPGTRAATEPGAGRGDCGDPPRVRLLRLAAGAPGAARTRSPRGPTSRRPVDAHPRHPGTSGQDQGATPLRATSQAPRGHRQGQTQLHHPGADLLWLTDITQIRTGQGWLYAAVILDAFNREVISWAVDGLDTPRTVMRALSEALLIRHPPRGCVIHSDRGYQFTSRDWLDLVAGNGLEVSIGERRAVMTTR